MREIYLHVCGDPDENDQAIEILKQLKDFKIRILATGHPPYNDEDIPWIQKAEEEEEGPWYSGLAEINEFVEKELAGAQEAGAGK